MGDIKIGQQVQKSATVIGLVALPAFGGQVVSELAKDAIGADLPDMVYDAAGGTLVAAAELGALYAIKGKATAMQALPFAAAGAAMCALLPALDGMVGSAVAKLTGTSSTPKALSGAKAATVKSIGSSRIAGGIGGWASDVGGVPGGLTDSLNNPAGGVFTY